MKQLECILLVDDDKATNFLNRRLLRKMEAAKEIEVVRNGSEAMEYLEKSVAGKTGFLPPNLILLDINMPLVDGWEFLQRYADFSENYKASTVVVMLTTSLRESDQERVTQFKEVKSLIRKPLTQEAVEQILAQHFPEKK